MFDPILWMVVIATVTGTYALSRWADRRWGKSRGSNSGDVSAFGGGDSGDSGSGDSGGDGGGGGGD